MNDKAGRQNKVEQYRRHRPTRNYAHRFWRFLRTNKNAVYTSSLLLVLVVLLFAVCSQLKPPTSANTVPGGMTQIDYSAFVKQVTAGNVVAVILRGNEINGLLATPLSPQTATAVKPTSESLAADYDAWTRYVGAANAGTVNISVNTTPTIKADRAIYTQTPLTGDPQLMSLLRSNHVLVATQPAPQSIPWLSLLWRFSPFILIVVILLYFAFRGKNAHSARSLGDRVSQMGKNRARRFERAQEGSPPQTSSPSPLSRKTIHSRATPTANSAITTHPKVARLNVDPPITFADVAGIDEVRAELEEIVQFLRTPERYDRLGARIPRGALLVGPPGTGKTLLAKAVAGEANVPFFSMSASEFVEMFVGVGASRVRDLFNQARQAAPCVVFIDEIDAVGRKRAMRAIGNNDERDQTLNQLLVELDGFDTRQAVVVMAATNRVDILDKALLRPGRFDRRITVSLPGRAGREAILQVHTRKTPLHEDVVLTRLARMTTGMSGADLANLVNEAALSAARRDMDKITHECFEEALARVQLGALRPIVMGERDRRIIAVHEGGHALVAHHLPAAETVNRVTILPRGQSLGVTQFIAEEDRYNYSREALMARIAVGLGGRVAEEITFGPDQITTGAENDLQVVTDLARRMVTRWGMSEQLGVVFADYRAEGEYSLNLRQIDPAALPTQARTLAMDAHGRLLLNGDLEARSHIFTMSLPAPRASSGIAMNALIDAEVQRILHEGKALAHQLLTEHYDQLTLLADTLIEREQLDRAQFEDLLKG